MRHSPPSRNDAHHEKGDAVVRCRSSARPFETRSSESHALGALRPRLAFGAAERSLTVLSIGERPEAWWGLRYTPTPEIA